MTKDQIINAAVSKFIGWPVPSDFYPDAFITFDRVRAAASNCRPTGTNLLSADQARAMFEYCLAEAIGTSVAEGLEIVAQDKQDALKRIKLLETLIDGNHGSIRARDRRITALEAERDRNLDSIRSGNKIITDQNARITALESAVAAANADADKWAAKHGVMKQLRGYQAQRITALESSLEIAEEALNLVDNGYEKGLPVQVSIASAIAPIDAAVVSVQSEAAG